ncbi:MAG: glycosyltransferase family 4 protein [Paracoccaceae bacterium]
MAITKISPQARCLDLTRLVSRVGRGPLTGLDRVELEYLDYILRAGVPVFSLVKLRRGYALLDETGTAALQQRLLGQLSWHKPPLISRLARLSPPGVAGARASVRASAIARAGPGRLRGMLEGVLPAGTAYLNVGHANLSQEVLQSFSSLPGARVTVFVHDTIPLDFPRFQRQKIVLRFERELRLVARRADLLICNSQATLRDVTRVMSPWGDVPDIVVAHLGIRTAVAKPAELPAGLDTSSPYFVVLGTIEPRKNHALLLDIWERLCATPDAPRLFVVGQRGWENPRIFERLDQRPANVHELNNLSDGAVRALLNSAAGLLFPSHCEGFGLPAVEAAALGIPLVCNNLNVFHEVLGDYPIYADASDSYSLETIIRKLAKNGGSVNSETRRSRPKVTVPNWDAHFDHVLRLT